MNVGEAKHFPALTADTAGFTLKGGLYAIICVLGDLDSVALELHMGGDNWLLIPSRQVAPIEIAEGAGDGGGTLDCGFLSDGVLTADLPPGTYRLNVEGADTDPPANVSIVRIQ